MNDLRAELAEALDEAEWEWLLPHVSRDSVIVVSHGLDLLDVGMAIVNDDTVCVQRWIAESLIAKPSPVQVTAWSGEQTKRFQALIVQPYVLVQEFS